MNDCQLIKKDSMQSNYRYSSCFWGEKTVNRLKHIPQNLLKISALILLLIFCSASDGRNFGQKYWYITSLQEEQKNALSEIQKKKDELEIQKTVLEAEVQKRNAVQETTRDFILTPYRSNFLQVEFSQRFIQLVVCLHTFCK